MERENHNLSYIFRILALEGLTPSKSRKIRQRAIHFWLALYKGILFSLVGKW
jgi:hypothetical protein